MKSLFEQMGGTYTQQGDYYLPDLKLPPEEERPVGVWGQRRLRYLREHRPILYTNLKTSGQPRSHHADVEVLTHQRANATRKGHLRLGVDLDLIDAGQEILDGIFDSL